MSQQEVVKDHAADIDSVEQDRPFSTEGLIALQMLDFADEVGKSLTPLQVNKFIYICHGWTLGFFDRPLIDNSVAQIEAWRYGPVVVNIYHMLKHFENRPVNIFDFYARVSRGDSYYDVTLFPQSGEAKPSRLSKFKGDYPEVFKCLKWVYDEYIGYSAGQLISLTHQEGTPWHQCHRTGVLGLVTRHIHIPDTVIKSYYKRRIR